MNVSEKIPSSTHHRSVRTSTTLTVIWIDLPCLFHLNVTETFAHTQQFCDYLSLFQESEQSGSGQDVLSNLHFRGMEGQCNVTTWSEHAKHYILTSDFDATLISETHFRKEGLLSAVTEAKKSGWAGTGSAAQRHECRRARTGPKTRLAGRVIRVMGREILSLTAYFEHSVGFRSDSNANLMQDVCFLTRDGRFPFILGADFNFPPSPWQDLSLHGGGRFLTHVSHG